MPLAVRRVLLFCLFRLQAFRAQDHQPAKPPAVSGNATWFAGLGQPYGGCGVPQKYIDSQDFVALNVFNTPKVYEMWTRPLPDDQKAKMGIWNNGHSCGRWVHVTIGDFCTGTNDGAVNKDFCRDGKGWTSDAYDGAELDMIVADSCGDSNAWCRDDPWHLDLSEPSLNRFVKDGKPVGDMQPMHWNNRQIMWYFKKAPNYSGDIKIGFLRGAQIYWASVAITHLYNGIHSLEYLSGTSWVKAKMNGDMGQAWLIEAVTKGQRDFAVRITDVDDKYINNGRVYKFSLPEKCGSAGCQDGDFIPVPYTTSDGSGSHTNADANNATEPAKYNNTQVASGNGTSSNSSTTASANGTTSDGKTGSPGRKRCTSAVDHL